MLWLQGVIGLLDHSDKAHHLSFQLLRAKLESIKHLESYGDLVRLPLLSLSWDEIQIVLSLFSEASLWAIEDGLYTMISPPASRAPSGCSPAEGHSLASLRSLVSVDGHAPEEAVCWMGGSFGVLRPVSQVDADNVILRLLDHLLDLLDLRPVPSTLSAPVKAAKRPGVKATSSILSPVSQKPAPARSRTKKRPARVVGIDPTPSQEGSPGSGPAFDAGHSGPSSGATNSHPASYAPTRVSTRAKVFRVGPSYNESVLQGLPQPGTRASRKDLPGYSAGTGDRSARRWLYISKSDIHGKGAFAKRSITAGTIIAKYTGIRRDSPREIASPKYTSDYVAQLRSGVTIDARDPETNRILCTAAYINDGFDPEETNATLFEMNGELYIKAVKDIQEHEEVVISYEEEYWCDSKWPSSILEKAYEAYKGKHPTAEYEAKWRETINAKIREENGLSATGLHGPHGPGMIERVPLRRERAGRHTTHLAFKDPHLVFSTWNAGYLGGNLDQSSTIADYFIQLGIDCLVLQDTRCTAAQSKIQAAILASKIRGAKVLSIPTLPAIQIDGHHSPAMGGTMVILSERAARLYKGHEADKTGLGLIVRINFAILHSPESPPWKFQVVAAYLPPKPSSNPGANTMWSKLQSYLAASATIRETSPRKYLEGKVTNWVHKSLARHELTLLMGDLNGVLDPGVRSRNVTEFVRSNGMHAPFTDILLPEREFHTFYRQDEGISRVDHILHSSMPDGVSLACLGVHSPPQYEPAFDHRPLFLGIHFADGFKAVPAAPDTVRAPRTDIRKTDWQSVADFVRMTDAAAGPLEDAISADPLKVANNLSVFIRNVVETTAILTDQSTITRLRGKHVNVYQKGMKRRGNPFKDGYSPHMRVIQKAMHLYLEVRQRVACKRSTQTPESPEFLSWLKDAVDHWEEGLRDLTKEDGSPFGSDLLGMQIVPADGTAPRDISPLTLLTATPGTFARGCLDESIHKLRSLLHGRARAR